MTRLREVGVLEGSLYTYEFDRDFSTEVTVYIRTDERVLVPNYKLKHIRTRNEQVLIANRNGSIEHREIVERLHIRDFFHRFSFHQFRRGVEVRDVVKMVTYDFTNDSLGYDRLLCQLNKINLSDNSKRRIRIRYPDPKGTEQITLLD
jgi:hypothetical protein